MVEKNNGIDALSRMLGGMEENISNLVKSVNSIEGKVDHTNDMTIRLESSSKSAHRRLDELYLCHKEDMDKIFPQMKIHTESINSLNHDRKTFVWLAAKISAGIGILFTILADAAMHLIR